MKYSEFLESKSHSSISSGVSAKSISGVLYDFQKHIVEKSLSQGRHAVFADCGLGKTFIQLEWANNIFHHTGKPVLILTPLAVAPQTIKEANKINIEAYQNKEGKPINPITVTNYERLHHFDPQDFSGMVCDESSILKNFNGAYRQSVTDFMRKLPYRLLATATAAPNDYTELGTSSEALGYMGFMDMLSKFFVNQQNNSALRRHYGEAPKWELKGHATRPFWEWVASWATALRKPSDLGFDDNGFILPPLSEKYHVIKANGPPVDMLFNLPALTLPEQRKETRRTLLERCEKARDLVIDTGDYAIVWCHLNDEADTIEKMIPDAVQVKGSDDPDRKEGVLTDFADGKIRVLITKPKIGAWGLNLQHCNHIVYFPSHSYEQYYQAVRRCWRFGQKRQVKVDVVLTEGQTRVMENLKRKASDASRMFDSIIQGMNGHLMVDQFEGTKKEELPTWL